MVTESSDLELCEKMFARVARKGVQKSSEKSVNEMEVFSESVRRLDSRHKDFERSVDTPRTSSTPDPAEHGLFRTLARKYVEDSLMMVLPYLPNTEPRPHNPFLDPDDPGGISIAGIPETHIPPTVASSLRSSQASSYQRFKRQREHISRIPKPSPHDPENPGLPSHVYRDFSRVNGSRWSIDELSLSFASSVSLSSSSTAGSLRMFGRSNRQSY
jgi:hypothetical protein